MASQSVQEEIVSTATAGPRQFGFESGSALLAEGNEVLHDQVVAKMETALSSELPQMDVRFKNLSLTADIVVVEGDGSKFELPTLTNTVKKAFVSPKKRVIHKEILKDISGMFAPGKLTLLLGQPGSGKSALMKLLSGRFPETKNITLEGDITYNSVERSSIKKTLPQFASYVNQRDKHYPLLTVKETLEFAHTFCGGEMLRRGKELLSNGVQKENLEALDLVNAVFKNFPDIVIQQLGLKICQDTIVGDGMVRGISGGERKRVTTGEMEFGMKYASFMDEISTGLDSAATFDIITTQRSIAHRLKKTIVIALLQPSPEVFALFDDVMILNEGDLMYHGPCSKVEDYFESLGFKCPIGRDVADYLLDLGTREQYRYQTGIPPRGGKHPRYAKEFADIFKQTGIHQGMLRALDTPHSPNLLANIEKHMDPMPMFHQGFFESTMTLFRRQLMVTYRNKPFIMGRLLMITVMGLLYCSTFSSFDPTQITVVIGVIFSSIMFLSMGQSAQVPAYLAERDIFYKQRGANFYRTTSYVLAQSVSQIPLAIAETIIFGTLVYWVCSFEADAWRFIIFLMILFLMSLTMGMWFFFLAAICPDGNIASPVGQVSILVMVIFAGFIVTANTIPDWLIWLHWLSPLSWSLRALSINQYKAASFNVCVYDSIDYCSSYGMTMGEYYLDVFDIETETAWIGYGVIYIIADYVIFMFLSFVTLEYVRYETPKNVDTSEDQPEEETYDLLETPKGLVSKKSAVGEHAIDVPYTDEMNFVPVTVAFQDLHYFVPDPNNQKNTLELLKGINGFAVPGSITALMGSSGAGKTTLMDVIAGRKTAGKITGKILLNGYEASDLAIRRCTGYCEQMDVHSEAATIREALTFSSFLRQDASISDAKKYDSVDECIRLLGLEDIADQIIRGSSVEQMKRLTIGVELAAQPSVIFLDEPTSGLDARSAKIIMDGVRKVADSGRTIICTIHQPSVEVFCLFNSLLLLKRGGETVFYGELGEDCRNLIDYFENIPGVAPLPVGYNPATWMLECIGAGVNNSMDDRMDFVRYFNNSPYRALLDANLAKDGVSTPSPDYPELVFSKKRAASSMTQMKFVVKRFIDMYWRSSSYNLTRLVVSLFLALLFGVIFVDADYASYTGLTSGIGMIFMASVFNSMISFHSVLPLSCEERASFYRERASQTYNAFWYFVGSTVAELPYCFLAGLIFTVIYYPFVGFQGFANGVLYWFNLSLMITMQTYFGQFFAYALPSEEVANIIGVLINCTCFLFMGFNPPAYAIPSGYKWLYTIVPHRFALGNLVSIPFGQCSEMPRWNETTQSYTNVGPELGCQPMANPPVTIGHITLKEYTEKYYEMTYDDTWRNVGIIIAYTVFFRILGLLALRYINHQKK